MTSASPPPDFGDLRGLLTIDVASELRKLSRAQLQGPWQLPAELVRRGVRAGARGIEVNFARHEVVVVDDGQGLDRSVLEWTAALLDDQRDNDQRHRALTALEAAGEVALLALAGVDDLRTLIIETTSGGRQHRLTFARGARPTLGLGLGRDADGRAGTRITLRSPRIDRAHACRWLTDVARFAPVPLLIDGVRVADAMAGCLAQASLRPPLQGRVALVPERDAAHVDLLAFGLVVAHLTIPGSPGFEAALEMGTADSSCDPASLRERSLALVPPLADQALALLIAAARQLGPRDDRRRAPLARLVLQAARRRQRRPEIDRLALFRTTDDGQDRERLVDLVTLAQLADREGKGTRSLTALSPGDRAGDHTLGNGPVLIADDAERSLLAEVLGLRFRAPGRRASQHSLGALARRLLHALGRSFERAGDLLRSSGRRPPLPDDVLSPQERALLIGLRAELRARPGRLRAAHLCEGDGPVRRTGGRTPTLFLPRDNPTVMACVRAFATDPGWLRLIHPALIAGPGNAARIRA
jgi:hypothetical protein